MGNVYRYTLAMLQILTGIFAGIVFVRSIVYGGEMGMTLLSSIMMILGPVSGVRGIRDINKH